MHYLNKVNQYVWVTFMLFCTFVQVTSAQKNYIAVKIDALGTFFDSKSGSIEYGLPSQKGNSLEWQFFYYQHGHAADNGLFNGELINKYGIITTNRFRLGPSGNVVSSEQEAGKTISSPIEMLSGYFPIRSFASAAGWRAILFDKSESKWQIWHQPGISLIWHEWYDVSSRNIILSRRISNYYDATLGSLVRVNNTTESYEQRQMMLHQTRLIGGLTYNFGVSRNLYKDFFIEARVHTLWNVYKSLPGVQPVRRFQIWPQIQVGYRIEWSKA
jgi:hypothetical protein